ncbi:hypothetical protein [Nocardioides psychrotolerans]|uniref:hypothetical protein n=1 Tax=Nocardioides psychrotolerans TaxID=1005945 RepID=UPI00313811FB
MIQHVLLDADGVLQELPGGWLAAVEPYAGEVGDVFLQDAWRVEKPALRGEADFLDDLPAVLARHGLDVSADSTIAPPACAASSASTNRADNVEGARSAGLAGVHWDLAEGHDLLLARLAEHGVRPEV